MWEFKTVYSHLFQRHNSFQLNCISRLSNNWTSSEKTYLQKMLFICVCFYQLWNFWVMINVIIDVLKTH